VEVDRADEQAVDRARIGLAPGAGLLGEGHGRAPVVLLPLPRLWGRGSG
jgi:hypothetical protein